MVAPRRLSLALCAAASTPILPALARPVTAAHHLPGVPRRGHGLSLSRSLSKHTTTTSLKKQQAAYRRGAAGARRDLIAAHKPGGAAGAPAVLKEEQKQEIR